MAVSEETREETRSDTDVHDDPHVAEPGVYLRIGEAAELTGLTQRTIRYYEELGLLTPPGRTQGDFRLFSDADIQRLRDVSRLKQLLGFSLAEIKKVVEGEERINTLRSEYHATEDVSTRLSLLDDALALTNSQLSLLERKMSLMSDMKAELEARRNRYNGRRKALVSDSSVK